MNSMESKIEENDKPDQNEYKIIYVNKKEIRVKEDVLTGKQILEYAKLEVDKYDLFLVKGKDSERIQDNQPCEINNKMQFHAILKSVPYG